MYTFVEFPIAQWNRSRAELFAVSGPVGRSETVGRRMLALAAQGLPSGSIVPDHPLP
jgi:hypothetical protein